jgi:hypothetical protein
MSRQRSRACRPRIVSFSIEADLPRLVQESGIRTGMLYTVNKVSNAD